MPTHVSRLFDSCESWKRSFQQVRLRFKQIYRQRLTELAAAQTICGLAVTSLDFVALDSS